MSRTYGARPHPIGHHTIDWHEMLHYLYLPIKIPAWDQTGSAAEADIVMPRRLEMLRPLVEAAWDDYVSGGHGTRMPAAADTYVYLTVRRGWATPDNPLNRPGWHTDGFGSDDLNYIWADVHPTRYAVQDFELKADDVESMRQMEAQVRPDRIEEGLPEWLYGLDPYVVHATPVIPPPGTMRSFAKISFSPHRYNLLGNSHNHDLAYDWVMHNRTALRNDPYAGERDYVS